MGRWVTGGLLLLDPFLMLTVYVGVRSQAPKGTLTGLSAGLFQDALTGTLFGMNGFSKTLIGFLCHSMSGRLLMTNTVPLLLMLVGMTVLDRLFLATLSLLLRGSFPLPTFGALFLLCACNAFAGLAMFRFAEARNRRGALSY